MRIFDCRETQAVAIEEVKDAVSVGIKKAKKKAKKEAAAAPPEQQAPEGEDDDDDDLLGNEGYDF